MAAEDLFDSIREAEERLNDYFLVTKDLSTVNYSFLALETTLQAPADGQEDDAGASGVQYYNKLYRLVSLGDAQHRRLDLRSGSPGQLEGVFVYQHVLRNATQRLQCVGLKPATNLRQYDASDGTGEELLITIDPFTLPVSSYLAFSGTATDEAAEIFSNSRVVEARRLSDGRLLALILFENQETAAELIFAAKPTWMVEQMKCFRKPEQVALNKRKAISAAQIRKWSNEGITRTRWLMLDKKMQGKQVWVPVMVTCEYELDGFHNLQPFRDHTISELIMTQWTLGSDVDEGLVATESFNTNRIAAGVAFDQWNGELELRRQKLISEEKAQAKARP